MELFPLSDMFFQGLTVLLGTVRWLRRNPCWRIAVVIPLLLGGVAFRGSAQERPVTAGEILIMRTSPAKVERSDGVFVVEVSAFDPLLVVKVNGFAQMVRPQADWQVFEVPYQLKPGENEFTVFVQTKSSEQQETFTMTYTTQEMQEEAQQIDPLSLALLLGYTQSDNMLQANATGTKRAAGRLDAVLMSGYRYTLTDTAGLTLKFLLKADRQLDRSLASREMGFRKLSLEYDHQRLLGMHLNTGMGQSVFSLKSTDTTKPKTLGEFQASTRSLFFFGGAELPFAQRFAATLKLQGDLQTGQSAGDAGTVITTQLGVRMRLGGLVAKLRGDSKSGAFQDTSKSYSSATTAGSLRMSWGDWTPHVQYQSLNQQYQQADSVTGVTVQNRRNTASFGGKYRWSEALLLDLFGRQIKVSSNEALNAYSESQATLQMLWSY